MSSIPPNWLGSIIQTQGAKARAAEEKQREQATQAERGGEGSFANKLQDVIDETDRDSQVYSDAEGTGSQGRPHTEKEEEEPPPEEGRDPDQNDSGLDLQA